MKLSDGRTCDSGDDKVDGGGGFASDVGPQTEADQMEFLDGRSLFVQESDQIGREDTNGSDIAQGLRIVGTLG